MNNILLALTFVIAALDWLAVWRKWRPLEYFAKPATMVILIVWLYMQTDFSGTVFWFGLGLLMSLLGDIFLMLPSEQFIAGLVSFLMAHVAYIIGFNSPLPNITMPMLAAALIIGLTAFRLIRHISAGLKGKGLDKLILPVRVYANVITLMLLSAMLALFRADWQTNPAILVSLGALLFFISDVVLAWNRFVNPVKHGRIINMVTYHLGQIALAVGAAMQFG